MLKIADITRDIIADNPLLQFGLYRDLYNLTQLAREIAPQVKARAKKDVSLSAIVMALSRHQRDMADGNAKQGSFSIENLTINGGLMTVTYPKVPEVQKGVQALQTALQEKNEYLTLSEGTSQITLIVEEDREDLLSSTIPVEPLFVKKDISSVAASFDEKYLSIPGMLYVILQMITLQNINIVEVSSTYTDIVIYVDEEQAKLAFETLYGLLS